MHRNTKMSKSKKKSTASLLLKEAQTHGIKWLADHKFRLFWTAAYLFLLWGSISILLMHISRFISHPTNIMRKEDYRTRMSFPSVLVFPELDYHEYKIDAFLDRINFPRDLNKTYIKSVIRQLETFYNQDIPYDFEDLENIERLLDFNNLSLREVTEALTTSCEETILKCRWKGVLVNCSELFRMELSDIGYCCVFNARSLQRELASGAKITKPQSTIYTTKIGPKSGLMFAINQSIMLSSMDRTYKWITITNPHRFVDSTNNNGTAISPGKEVWFGYDTESFHVAEDARSLDAGLRLCSLSDTKLEYFPVYHKLIVIFMISRKNYCVLECAIREALRHCRCVLFTHPARPGVPYCKARQLMCARLSTGVTAATCSCLKTCDVDTSGMSIVDFMMSPEITPLDSFYEGLDFSKVTIIKVFVEYRELYVKVRRSYFTQIDLFAQMGGIFNVFFGCSILSLLELAQLGWYTIQQWRQKRRNNIILEDKLKIKAMKENYGMREKKVRFMTK